MYATYFDFKQAAYEPAHSNSCGSMLKKNGYVVLY